MATGVKSWSKTAANNATADSAAPWPEGMLPGQVNDSSRGGMASVAKWRDDISGVIVTSGTASAYTVASNQNFSALTELDGMVIAFTPHVTNGTAPTLSVDGLAAKPAPSGPWCGSQSNVLLAWTLTTRSIRTAITSSFFRARRQTLWLPLAGGLDYWATSSCSAYASLPVRPRRTAYAALLRLTAQSSVLRRHDDI